MNEHDDDPLWNPRAAGDTDLRRIETLLAPYRVRDRAPAHWHVPAQPAVVPRQWRRRIGLALAAGIAALVVLAGAHRYRLAWTDDAPWRVTRIDDGTPALLAPGESIRTGAGDTRRIAVARIGEITLSPQSTLRLVETRGGRHRVDLREGHLRARIWAPPNQFGVVDAHSEVIDLGCEFDLWKSADGSGTVQVRSGWIAYRVGTHEVLVPAGYGVRFDGQRPSTPLRIDADPAFADAVHALEHALATPGAATQAAEQAVAHAARDDDAVTLLTVLSQSPSLADGALYPRLAQALGIDTIDPQHRSAWRDGQREAIDAWWARLPSRPKQWWLHWADAFG